MIIDKVKRKINFITINSWWRKHNKNNFTHLAPVKSLGTLELIKNGRCTVGAYTYGTINIRATTNEQERVSIGNFCSLSGHCVFLSGGEHSFKSITTYPFRDIFFHSGASAQSKGTIVVGDEVWIADNVLIMSGVHIGKGAVIGAGSLVTKDVPPYSIVGGIPAKVIKYRFSSEIIEKLLPLNLLDYDFRPEDLNLLEEEITEQNIDLIMEHIHNRRKR